MCPQREKEKKAKIRSQDASKTPLWVRNLPPLEPMIYPVHKPGRKKQQRKKIRRCSMDMKKEEMFPVMMMVVLKMCT
jgi:hypothetical protein